MAICDCGAPADGKWADKHSAGCASHGAPSVAEIAKLIGSTPTDLDSGCDRACETDGGTCICAELYTPVAKLIFARFGRVSA